MVGQKNILDWIDNLSDVPSFIIIVGGRGCGKTMLAKYIADKLKASFSISGIKVDEVRDVIDTAYHASDAVLYCIKDADTMRPEAKNAMLKITEEPPKNAHFVMTVQDDSSLLDTIKSRGTLLHIEPYSQSEISEYGSKYPKSELLETAIEIANTPYELDMIMSYGEEFLDYVNLVADNIADVQPANAFKSSSKLALKNEDDKYDLKVFWSTFVTECLSRISDDPVKYALGIATTTPYLNEASRLGINKQQLYDNWVFKIREVWE